MAENTMNKIQLIDLGLPSGTLWAACNVGATSPEQAGLYFAWGEISGFAADEEGKSERAFFWENYKGKEISYDLTSEQDAAHACMGGNWRMPTKDQFQELLDNCNVVWTTNYNGTGVSGYIFTSKVNGNSVFFPAAGYCYNSSVGGVGSDGGYWSASWNSSSSAWRLYFYSGSQILGSYLRYYGCPVRAVCE